VDSSSWTSWWTEINPADHTSKAQTAVLASSKIKGGPDPALPLRSRRDRARLTADWPEIRGV